MGSQMTDVMTLGGAAVSAAHRKTAKMALDALAPNKRRAYSGAIRRLGQWLGVRQLDDAALAEYLQDRFAEGASTTETMLAGNWKIARMVAHYSAGAKAQRGAVAKFF